MTSTVHLTAKDHVFLGSLLLAGRNTRLTSSCCAIKLETATVVPTELVHARTGDHRQPDRI